MAQGHMEKAINREREVLWCSLPRVSGNLSILMKFNAGILMH
jgi:hypothetical protein